MRRSRLDRSACVALTGRELSTASYKTILREGTARAAERAGIALSDSEALVADWHTIGAFPDTVAALEELQLGLRRVWVDREDSGHDASIVTARVPDMASLAQIAAKLYDAP